MTPTEVLSDDEMLCPYCEAYLSPTMEGDDYNPARGRWQWEHMDTTKHDWVCQFCSWVWSGETVQHFNRENKDA